MQGKFKPNRPDKYKGDTDSIFWRSSWELVLMKFLDNTPEVLAWNSEEVQIPYYDPVKGKSRRYFMDFKCWVKTHDGSVKIILIEVKPKSQTRPPRNTGKKSEKTLLLEKTTWITNQAKWKAAKEYCDKQGWLFKIITEDELFSGIDKGYKRKKK